MALSVPNNFDLCLTKDQISKGTEKVARELNNWYQSVPEDLKDSIVALCILRGGMFFCADLIRQIDFNLEIEFVDIFAYDEDKNMAKSDPSLGTFAIDVNLKDKIVIVIDDICESGKTLKLLRDNIKGLGARDFKSAVLISRAKITPILKPDFFACLIEHTDFLVGMGLDDKKKFRHLPDIYRILSPK